MKATITKEQLNLFVVCGKHYISVTPPEQKSILWESVNSLLPLALKKLKKVEHEKELHRLNLCKKTSTKHIDKDKNGGYQFTEDDNIKLIERFAEIDQATVEMSCNVINEFPEEGLTYDMRKAFEGIVIPATEEVKEDE